MSSANVTNTSAVFTCATYPRPPQTRKANVPPAGRLFAQDLADTFDEAGFPTTQMARDEHDPSQLWWENTYWYFFLSAYRQEYFVQVEPIGDSTLWRVAFSQAGGVLSIFRKQSNLTMPSWLQRRAEELIVKVAKCDDLRWIDEAEALALWT